MLSFVQRLAHQAEFAVFKITKSAVDETSGEAGGAAGEITFVDEQNGQPTHSSVARDAGTVDAGADYYQVKRFVEHVVVCRSVYFGLTTRTI